MTAAGARSGLLIVWWSMTGASCQLAHAAALRANEALREGEIEGEVELAHPHLVVQFLL